MCSCQVPDILAPFPANSNAFFKLYKAKRRLPQVSCRQEYGILGLGNESGREGVRWHIDASRVKATAKVCFWFVAYQALLLRPVDRLVDSLTV